MEAAAVVVILSEGSFTRVNRQHREGQWYEGRASCKGATKRHFGGSGGDTTTQALYARGMTSFKSPRRDESFYHHYISACASTGGATTGSEISQRGCWSSKTQSVLGTHLIGGKIYMFGYVENVPSSLLFPEVVSN